MTESDIVRELLQYDIIRGIFTNAVENEIALKGGFAMRALFNSIRRTKDIDLHQNPAHAPLSRVQNLVRTAIKTSLRHGLLTDVTVSEPKQTNTVARWKVNGRTSHGSLVHLTIEVSRRPMPPADCLERVPMRASTFGNTSDNSFTLVDTYSPNTMAAAKTIALLADNRVAPRDLWDLDILISMRAEPPVAMIAHLRNERARSILFDKMELMTWEMFRSEVLPSLPDETARRMTQDKFETMKVRVALAIEKWLADPGDSHEKADPAETVPAP